MRVLRHAALAAFLLLALLLATLAAVGGAPFLFDPLRSQVDGTGRAGYSTASLAVWGLVGGVGLLAYAVEARSIPLLRPTGRTLLALLPLLAAGPLAHALLSADALPAPVRWFAAEPLVYASVAACALLLGAGGALSVRTDRPRGRDLGLALGGVLLLGSLLVLAAPAFGSRSAFVLGLVAASAAIGTGAWVVVRWARVPGFAEGEHAFAAAVFFGHALDGLTTWMGVRDPFGWGVGGFAEKNPVSAVLLDLGNGWPFVLVKLLLPAVILYALWDLEEEFHRNLALLAVFALGFGPGAANALQMSFGG